MSLELTQAAKNLLADARLRPGARCPAAAPHGPARDRGRPRREDALRRGRPRPDRAGRRRGRGPEATFTFEGSQKGQLPDLPPLEPVGGPDDTRGPGRHPEERLPAHADGTARSPTVPAVLTLGCSARAGRSDRRSTTRPSAIRLGRPARAARPRARPAPAAGGPRCPRRRAAPPSADRGTIRSVPAQAWPRRGGPSYAGRPASVPGAPVARPGTSRTSGRRPCTPARRAPSPPPPRWRRLLVGQRATRPSVALGPRDRGGRELHAADRPGEHPAHVGVEHGVAAAEGEARRSRWRCSRRLPGSASRSSYDAGTSPPCRSTIAAAAACRRSARRG